MALLTLATLSAAALGTVNHVNAKKINEKAEEIVNDAQKIYKSAQNALEKSKKSATKSLKKIEKRKKHVFNTSLKIFVDSFEKVKHISFDNFPAIDKLDLNLISRKEVVEIVHMDNLYGSSFSGSIAGATLTTGLAMTSLATIVAPVVLFTGISSKIKANENLRKANTMYYESKSAASKMKTQIMICDAISKKAKMFDELLRKLNDKFEVSSNLLAYLIQEKEKTLNENRPLKNSDFSEDEIKLLAITGSLAKAVKQVIVTNILNEKGEISTEAIQLSENSERILMDSNEKMKIIESLKLESIALSIRNKSRHSSKTFKFIKKIPSLLLVLSSAYILYYSLNNIKNTSYFWICIIVSIVSLFLLGKLYIKNKKESLNKVILKLMCTLLCFAIGILIYMGLNIMIGLSSRTSIILTELLFLPMLTFFILSANYNSKNQRKS